MLEQTGRSIASADRSGRQDHAPLVIRRIDAIPVALPLKTPMKMSAETITAAQNLLVRIETSDGTVGCGEAASVAYVARLPHFAPRLRASAARSL